MNKSVKIKLNQPRFPIYGKEAISLAFMNTYMILRANEVSMNIMRTMILDETRNCAWWDANMGNHDYSW